MHHSYRLLLHQAGDTRKASQQLQTALDIYTGLGATPCAQRVAADLASCGIAPTSETDTLGALAALTERERAVAHLAAQGHTNSEIARSLYNSAKTVEYHLGHVYTKLDITNRRQLRTFQPLNAG